MTNTHLRARLRVLASVLVTMAVGARNLVAQGGTITLLDYKATVPSTWVSKTPSSNSRLAQFIVPGKDSAEIVVYFFGASMGGNVDANLARWRGQFTSDDAKPASERVTRDSTGKFPLTIAEYSGNYRRGLGGLGTRGTDAYRHDRRDAAWDDVHPALRAERAGRCRAGHFPQVREGDWGGRQLSLPNSLPVVYSFAVARPSRCKGWGAGVSRSPV